MGKLYCFIVSLCLTLGATAQKTYFIYLQTDNNSPFYIKMDDKIYSSTTSGYFILSDVIDSTYNFSIGFPGERLEAKFKLQVSGDDKGYLIKRFDFGIGLFDLQSLRVVKPQADETRASNVSYIARDDQFTSLLSKAADDTTIMFIPVIAKQDVAQNKEETKPTEVKPEEIKPNSNTQAMAKDTVAVADITITQIQTTDTPKADSASMAINNPVRKIENNRQADTLVMAIKDPPEQVASDSAITSPEQPYKRSTVKKYAESSTSEGFGLVFFDKDDKGIDTIRLLIPNPKITFKQPDSAVTETQALDIRKDTVQQQSVTEQVPIVVTAGNTKSSLKSNCRDMASDNDFKKLRKNMASKNTDEDMVAEAKKFFRNKCYTTEQIKNLSTLFLTSAGKYQFFDSAYLHVSDQDQFDSLQSEIKDEYYVKRFKALIGD
jgi:hypothetical protein